MQGFNAYLFQVLLFAASEMKLYQIIDLFLERVIRKGYGNWNVNNWQQYAAKMYLKIYFEFIPVSYIYIYINNFQIKFLKKFI